jgi:hypothetical protein
MSEPDLDDLLQRYRPAGPPPELRARVVANKEAVRRTWPWAAAAAALLVAVCAMQVWTREVYEEVRHDVAPQTEVSILADLPALANAVEADPALKERIEALARQEASQSRPPVGEAGASWQ